jgi:hypothetical protein
VVDVFSDGMLVEGYCAEFTGGWMKAYDHSEKAKHEQARQRSLEAIDAGLARHEKVTRIILIVVLILAGLSFALFVAHLIDHSN